MTELTELTPPQAECFGGPLDGQTVIRPNAELRYAGDVVDGQVVWWHVYTRVVFGLGIQKVTLVYGGTQEAKTP